MTSRVELVVRELRRGERQLAAGLEALAERHPGEHEVFHVARDVARWSRQHLAELDEVAASDGRDLAVDVLDPATGLVPADHEGEYGADPALLLVADLRRVHLLAAGVSVDWEILAQTAQATKDEPLLQLASRSHPETLRQMRWANAVLKQVTPQAMAG